MKTKSYLTTILAALALLIMPSLMAKPIPQKIEGKWQGTSLVSEEFLTKVTEIEVKKTERSTRWRSKGRILIPSGGYVISDQDWNLRTDGKATLKTSDGSRY